MKIEPLNMLWNYSEQVWRCFVVLTIAVLFGLTSGTAKAVPTPLTLNFNETGNGTSSPAFFSNDPGPGGLNGVLTYNLTFAGVQGDILVQEPGTGQILDVIRFNGNGTLIFYSDNVGGADSKADTPSPPSALYSNTAIVSEIGSEGNNGFVYTPTAGQPGFNASNPSTTYDIISDSPSVPDQGTTCVLFGIAIAGLFAFGQSFGAKRVKAAS